MKKTETHPRINRNNDLAYNHTNRGSFCISTISSNKVISQNWLQDTETSGLNIIELNSSTSTETSMDDALDYSPQGWSYLNNDEFQNLNKDYSANKNARQERRMTIDSQRQYTNKPDLKYKNRLMSKSTNLNNIYQNSGNFSHPVNCFTIINRHFVNSDTSSDQEDYSNIELTQQMGDVLVNHDNKDQHDDIDAYDLGLQAKKRIISIYSFKNKHLLAENDRNLINTSFDTDSSCSLKKISEETNVNHGIGTCRISSPIPSVYVPRLDLSAGQTLSTVTELSDEADKYMSPAIERSKQKVLKQKPINNWFVDYSEGLRKPTIDTKEASVNVVNWLALSPRQEKRRHNMTFNDKLESEPNEVLKYLGKDSKFTHDQKNKDTKTLTHFVVKAQESGNKLGDKNCILEPTSNYKNELTCKSPIIDRIQTYEHYPVEPEIIDNNSDQELHIRKIRISNKRPTRASKVTSPIEKLESNNWIIEDNEIEQSSIYKHKLELCRDVVRRNISNVTRNDRLWSKNAKLLMKPADWDEYQSITETPISLSLSFDNGLEKKSLLSRLIKCFRCFKWYK